MCEAEGVTSLSAQKQLRAIAKEKPIMILSFEDGDFDLPWLKP
jgi:hypothetical protein